MAFRSHVDAPPDDPALKMKNGLMRAIARFRESDAPVYAVVAIVVTVAALIDIPRDGYLAWGDIYPLYAMPGNHALERSLQLWGNAFTGMGSPLYAPSTFVFSLWGQLWIRLGVGGPTTQWLMTLALLLFEGLSVAFFARTLFPESKLVALIAGTALPLSFYSALSLHSPIVLFALGYFPLSAAFLMRRLREPTTALRFAVEIGLLSLGFLVLATAPPIAVFEILWALSWLVGGWLYWRTFSRTWVGLLLGVAAAAAVNAWWAYAAYLTLFASGGSAVQTFADPAAWKWVDQRASIPNLLSMQAVWSYPRPEYFPWAGPYLSGFNYLALFAPAAFALVGLVLAPYRRRTWLLFAIICVSVFIGKGYHPPLGRINAFLYAKLPLYWLFRDPQEATNITLYLAIFVLAGVGLAQLVSLAVRVLRSRAVENRRATVVAAAAGFGLMLLLLSNGWAFLSGDFIPKWWLNGDARSAVLVPHYWEEAADFLNAQPDESRILQLPNNDFYQMPYDWGYYGADGVASTLIQRPVLSVSPVTYNYVSGAPTLRPQFGYLVNAIRQGSRVQLAPLLSALGVGWILQRNDVTWSRPYRAILSPKQIRSYLSHQPRIEKAATFGKLDLYRVATRHGDVSAYNGLALWRGKNPQNLLLSSALAGEVPWTIGDSSAVPGDLVKLSAASEKGKTGSVRVVARAAGGITQEPVQSEKRSSTRYDVIIPPHARVLVLHSSYSTGWVVKSDGKELGWRHLPIDGFLNGWLVPENGPKRVSLVYRPARAFAVLQTLSLVVLCFLVAGLVLLPRSKQDVI
jgi:hypothetical protein